MRHDRTYLIFSLTYAVLGMCLGIFMAASHNHAQHVTHAHILLVGFVVSFIYAIIHKLWLSNPARWLASLQLALHQVAAVAMFIGLVLLYGAILPADQVEPILALASITVLVAALLMLAMVLGNKRSAA